MVITKLMDVFINSFDESAVRIDDACWNEILFGWYAKLVFGVEDISELTEACSGLLERAKGQEKILQGVIEWLFYKRRRMIKEG